MTINRATEASRLQTTITMRESRVVRVSFELGDAIKKPELPKLKSDDRIRAALDVNAVNEANVF